MRAANHLRESPESNLQSLPLQRKYFTATRFARPNAKKNVRIHINLQTEIAAIYHLYSFIFQHYMLITHLCAWKAPVRRHFAQSCADPSGECHVLDVPPEFLRF